MHDLAALNFASPVIAPWEEARVPVRLLSDFRAVHIKAMFAREPEFIAAFGLPGRLAVASVGNAKALWIGPAEWLLLAAPADQASLDEFANKTREWGAASARADSRLVILGFDGDADFVAGLTGLSASAVAPHRVARTRLADIPVTLAANANGAIRLIFDRTHAPHIRAWLDRAI